MDIDRDVAFGQRAVIEFLELAALAGLGLFDQDCLEHFSSFMPGHAPASWRPAVRA
jgi:hypothetical protein